jgi:transcriptional regulator with XRE-family HTH domain
VPDVPRRFGEKLRALRLQRDLSLRELADALGYEAHVYLNLVETGKKSPSLTLVMRAAAFFNVTMDQLARDDLDLDIGGDFSTNTDADA